MVRMSDILKKIEKRQGEEQASKAAKEAKEEKAAPSETEETTEQTSELSTMESSAAPPELKAPAQDEPIQDDGMIDDGPSSGVKLSRMNIGKSAGINEDNAIRLYDEALGVIKDIYDKVRDDVDVKEEDKLVPPLVEQFVEQQLLDNDNIVGLVSLPFEGDYIYNHVVNVSIIAVEIGIGLGFDKKKLVELGIAAIFCDIGMMRFLDLCNQPRALKESELEKIKKHTEVSFEILSKFRNIDKRIATVAYQMHERQDGSGYPMGIKGDTVDEFVKIIGVADVYDALTHPRAHREGLEPYEALNQVINTKDSLGPQGVKAFIERINCPYPIGCYVKLSTGEKGMVVGRNIGSSFRPVVELFYSQHTGSSGERRRIVDLKKVPYIHIKSYLSRDELSEFLK